MIKLYFIHLLVFTAVGLNAQTTIAINEFMASNQTTIADEFGEFDDWLELYNYGDDAVFLGDKYLSDKPDNPTKWQLPEMTLEADEYLLIWVDEDGPQGNLHTNFKLSADGEFIGIFAGDAADNALIDGLEFGEQTPDISFGRLPNGTGEFQSLQPTPGTSNTSVSVDILADFQLTAVFSPNPFANQLQIQLNNPQGLNVRLEIVDAVGRTVVSETISATRLEKLLPTQAWAAGLFSLVIKLDNQVVYTEKLIKS